MWNMGQIKVNCHQIHCKLYGSIIHTKSFSFNSVNLCFFPCIFVNTSIIDNAAETSRLYLIWAISFIHANTHVFLHISVCVCFVFVFVCSVLFSLSIFVVKVVNSWVVGAELGGEHSELPAEPPAAHDTQSLCWGQEVGHKRPVCSWIRNLITPRQCHGESVSLSPAQYVITTYWQITIGSSSLFRNKLPVRTDS